MQTTLLFIDWPSIREHFGKIEDLKKDEVIRYKGNVIRGLKGEITKIKNKQYERTRRA